MEREEPKKQNRCCKEGQKDNEEGREAATQGGKMQKKEKEKDGDGGKKQQVK